LLPLNFFKHIFGSAAHWADPVIREFAKRCVWRNITVRIALFWIINVTTDFALPLFHLYLLSTPFPPPEGGVGACAMRLFKYFIVVKLLNVILVLALLLNQKGEEIS